MADAIDEIIEREGAETNDAEDTGGLTRFGIAQNSHPEVDVSRLTRDEAREIYLTQYVKAPHFDLIPFEPLREQLVDWGVNAGPVVAVTALQRILHTTSDGQLGPVTLKALSKRDALEVNNLLVDAREQFYYRLALIRPTNKKYLKGWLRRARSFRIR